MHRRVGELGFADRAVEGLGRGGPLEALSAVLDWGRIGDVVSGVYSSATGRPSWPPLVMVRCLLLQQWYGLSDPRLEEALGDSLSMRRFAGLSLEDGTPDHSVVSRFRKRLAEGGLEEALFEEVNRQLDGLGLIVRKGVLVDATLVEARAAKPSWEEGRAARGRSDPDADWTRKGGRPHYGYRAHVGVDQGSLLIRRAVLTPARASESGEADGLIPMDVEAVYADRGYESKRRRARLRAEGVKDRIMHRSHKNQDGLPRWQKRRNRLIAKVRAPVEGVFATMKGHYGCRRVRYFSLEANRVQFMLMCAAINLRRAVVLVESAA